MVFIFGFDSVEGAQVSSFKLFIRKQLYQKNKAIQKSLKNEIFTPLYKIWMNHKLTCQEPSRLRADHVQLRRGLGHSLKPPGVLCSHPSDLLSPRREHRL